MYAMLPRYGQMSPASQMEANHVLHSGTYLILPFGSEIEIIQARNDFIIAIILFMRPVVWKQCFLLLRFYPTTHIK